MKSKSKYFKKKPLFSIIMTNKNAYQWLDKSLSSISKQTYRNFEVIFVDNCSTDSSVEFVSKKYPQIKIIRNQKDLGFAGANNIGAYKARGNFLFFLNTDTYFEKDILELLAKTIKNNEKIIYQLDIKYYDKSNLKNKPFGFGMDYFGYPIGDGNFFYADGAAFIIETDFFKKLGGFDREYYMYLEDLDLCWRARLMGASIKILPKIYIYHYGGGTSISTGGIKKIYTTTISRRYHAQKNNLRSLIKNYSFINILWSLPISCLFASIEGFLYLLKGNYSAFIALHKAIFWNILNIKDTLKERGKIQKIRIISDKIILKICDKRISKLHSFLSHGIPLVKS